MDLGEVRLLLNAVRGLRSGRVDLVDQPDWIQQTMRGNLAGLCRSLAAWADDQLDDRRAADAFVRIWGLGQMPERRAAVAATLRARSGRRGLSPEMVDELAERAERQLATEIDTIDFPGQWGLATPARWCDPFADPASPGRERRAFDEVRYLAWADIPDSTPLHQVSRALLLFEHEHGLDGAPVVDVQHRQERLRLRRLAWSMLWTARQRRAAKEPDDVVIDRLLGPRQLAVIDELPVEVADFLLQSTETSPHDNRELIGATVESARHAFAVGRQGTHELLGLVRDAVSRQPVRGRSHAAMATVLSLHAIYGREHLRLDGVQPALEAIAIGTEALDALRSPSSASPIVAAEHLITVSAGTRAAQEVAELLDARGRRDDALRALRVMRRLVSADLPDDNEHARAVRRQQYLQTASSVLRHTSETSRRPEHWLTLAARAAEAAAEITTRADLPPVYRVAAANQRSGALLALAAQHGAARRSRARRAALREAGCVIDEARQQADDIVGPSRPLLSLRLTAHRRSWELALANGDRDEIAEARRDMMRHVGDWTLPLHLREIHRLDATSAAP